MTQNSRPEKAPRCYICRQGPVALKFVSEFNEKGNAHRPYYACCKFLCFADDRGLDPYNPICDCKSPSRRQISGPATSIPRRIFYVCSLGTCDFFATDGGPGDYDVVDERDVEDLIRGKWI